jgi:hypothetical protein
MESYWLILFIKYILLHKIAFVMYILFILFLSSILYENIEDLFFNGYIWKTYLKYVIYTFVGSFFFIFVIQVLWFMLTTIFNGFING